jgi:hypothetical protein
MPRQPLPELLRDLGAEPFLDDPDTLRQLAHVAFKRAHGACDANTCLLELELYMWCTRQLQLTGSGRSITHANLFLLN